MSYTLGEAAKATGKSKATLSKAIKSGKISAVKESSGAFKIDPSELFRVYPPNTQDEQKETPRETPENQPEISELRAKLEAALQRISDKDEVISDLREDRDKWRQQATALLTDARDQSPNRPALWKRIFG